MHPHPAHDDAPARPPGGLRAPRGPVLPDMDAAHRRSPLRLALQLLGFLIGAALFGWAVSLALSMENREQLKRLLDAPWWVGAALLMLTCGSIALNGVVFWVTLRPLRRLSSLDCVAVNALATLCAFLPFKLSLLVRVLIHRRRDRLSYKSLVGWFAATGGLSIGTLGVLGAASVLHSRVDALWLLTVLALLGAFALAVLVCARFIARSPRLSALTLGAAPMGSRASGVIGHIALRICDVALQAARFLLIAQALGCELRVDHALLLSIAYFLGGVLSPVGSLGAREAGVMALGAAMGVTGLDVKQIAQIAVVVTALEAASSLLMSLWGAWRVRLLTLLSGEVGRPAPVTEPAQPSA